MNNIHTQSKVYSRYCISKDIATFPETRLLIQLTKPKLACFRRPKKKSADFPSQYIIYSRVDANIPGENSAKQVEIKASQYIVHNQFSLLDILAGRIAKEFKTPRRGIVRNGEIQLESRGGKFS